MKQEAVPVTVRIQDKEFLVGCPPNEQEELMASARYLDSRMKDIRSGGKIIGADRIAIMAALNITHELLQLKKKERGEDQAMERLKALQDKLESAVHSLKQLEF